MSAPADSNGLATGTPCDKCADEPVVTHQCSLCGAMCQGFHAPSSYVTVGDLVSGLVLIWFGRHDTMWPLSLFFSLEALCCKCHSCRKVTEKDKIMGRFSILMK